ncbi:tetratricopeptide repeat protein [Zhouia sp. PK063]|uniref:ATP-binding protein n=1 Tax=Zhouia sp. PK063 TaxID=3373602 RepID=UPI0037944FA5
MKPNCISFLFFCMLLLSFNYLKAQQTKDSVYAIFNTPKNTHDFDIQLQQLQKAIIYAKAHHQDSYLLKGYIQKSYVFNQLHQKDSAIFYAQQIIQLSPQLHDTTSLGLGYRKLADYSRLDHNIPTAIIAYEKSTELFKQLKDTAEWVRDLRFLASLQQKIGLSFEAETSATTALSLLDHQTQDKKTELALIGVYNQLGIIYKERENYDYAVSLYERAIAKTENPSYQTTLLNNIGNIYLKQGKYQDALTTFEKVYQQSINIPNTKLEARAIDNRGLSKLKLHRIDALTDFTNALQLREHIHYSLGIYTSYYHLAQYHQYFHQPQKALLYAQKSYTLAQELHLTEDLLNSIALLIQLGDTKYANTYVTLKDSLQTEELHTRNKYMGLKYDYQKEHALAQQNEIKYLKSNLEREHQQRRKVFWQIVGVGITLLSVAIFFIYRQMEYRKTQDKIYRTETRISKQVHDEIANDIYHTMNTLSHYKGVTVVVEQLEKIYEKTRDISRANSNIDTEGNFSLTLQDLIQPYKTEGLLIILKGLTEVKWSVYSRAQKINLFRVIQELMTNMKKYSNARMVTLSFSQHNKKLTILYKDNGVGTNLQRKNGLKNTETRMDAIKGKINFESSLDNGFKATIQL